MACSHKDRLSGLDNSFLDLEKESTHIAIMSYNGKLDFGLLGDYDAMRDIDDLGRFVEESLAELLREAEHAERPRGRRAAAARREAPLRATT
jgi:hypothetical protein